MGGNTQISQYAVHAANPVHLQVLFQVPEVGGTECERTVVDFFSFTLCIGILIKGNQPSSLDLLEYRQAVSTTAKRYIYVSALRVNA